MRLACTSNEGGGQESVESCRMGEVESVGTVELACFGRLLRMGCDPFLILCVDLLEVGKLYGSRMGYQGNILLSAGRRGRRGRDKKPNYIGEEGERPSQKA